MSEPLVPIHASEVLLIGASSWECVIVFLEIAIEQTEGDMMQTKTVLRPAVTVAVPWATAKAMRAVLDDQIGKYEAQVEAMRVAQERPN